MIKQRFNRGLIAVVAIVATAVFTPLPTQAAGVALDITEPDGASHIGGSATLGADQPAAMSAVSSAIQPYTYGQYVVIWNLANPTRKTITKYQYRTYSCTSKADADRMSSAPQDTTCVDYSEPTRDFNPIGSDRRPSSWTFSNKFGKSDLHKKWLRVNLTLTFSDNTQEKSWTKSRYYINDDPRNEIPTASTRGANNLSVPQNTTMNMTFNRWQGLFSWTVSSVMARSANIFRCNSRPTDFISETIRVDVAPAGCIELAELNKSVSEENIEEAFSVDFTTGNKDSYIYAVDTLTFSSMPGFFNTVQLQKRAIYYTYDPAELPNGPNPVGGANNPNNQQNPLQSAGINTTTAPIVTTTGQVTTNGITAVINVNNRYQRGRERRALKLQATPNRRARGTMVAALVSTKDGVDTVHRTVTKQIRRGKAEWKWRFPATLARGRYMLYVSITPTNPDVAPITLTKKIRLR